MAAGPVLVTGGSRGIGRAVVEALVARGRPVAFTWRSAGAEARNLEASIGGLARAFHLDLADRQRPASLVEEAEAAVGPLEGLVNNAGFRRDGLLAMTSDADWDAVVDANLGGAFRICRAVLPGMVRRRTGAIVNVASLTALHGVAGQASYAAAKAGLLAMTRVLAREMGRRNIRVNAVVPGYVPTGLVEDLPEEAVRALRARESLPAGVTAASVAGVIAFLLSDEARAVTGQAVAVDAGSTA
jgi:3-oxoacyl-[acyl-carrier protein] reductase